MRIAIVGATGAVGREMVQDLEDSSLSEIDLKLFASPRSKGTKITFRGRSHEVAPFSVDALKETRYVLMSAGGDFSREYSQALVRQGSTVIDNSSAFRMHEDVPLIVPEVNGKDFKITRPTLIANPNCSTAQLVVALSPLKKLFGLEMVQVATYQSVSGTGQKGISELGEQLEAKLKFKEVAPKAYAQSIAFNLLPAISDFDADGHCGEEIKMVRETQRILGQPGLAVLATTVRVPTFFCHGEAVHVRLSKAISREDAFSAFRQAPGLVLVEDDDHAKLPTNLTTTRQTQVYVSRVRIAYQEARSHWLQFWNIADNLKKGAATNAVQILEMVLGK